MKIFPRGVRFDMKKKIGFILVLLGILMPKVIFANTTNTKTISTKASPIQFNKDEYVRITQPTKDKTAVFDEEVNVTGEARDGTEIQIQLFNKKDHDFTYPRKAYRTYNLDEVGISRTFNELIELEEGDNRVRLIYKYKNTSGEIIEGRIVIYITRKSEAEKEVLKNLRIDSPDKLIK